MQEKKEKPSSSRIRKAKEREGGIASQELTSSIILLGSGMIMALFFSSLSQIVENYFKCLDFDGKSDLFFLPLLSSVTLPFFLMLSMLFVLQLFAHIVQRGWIWNFKPAKKGHPFWFFKVLKVIVVALLGYLIFFHQKLSSFESHMVAESQALVILKNFFSALMICFFIQLIIGIGDFFFQKWRYHKSLCMTAQEKRDEMKESEGNPNVKLYLRGIWTKKR